MQSLEPDDAHTEPTFGIGKNQTRMRSRDHRRYQFPADFVSESVAPSSGKDDLSGGTVEASRHPCTDLPVGKATQSFGKDDHSGETVEASCHVCADLLVEDVVPSSGKDDLSGETGCPLVNTPCHGWILVHTQSPFLTLEMRK